MQISTYENLSIKMYSLVLEIFFMSSAGVGPLYFIKSKVSTGIHQETLKHSILYFADRFYGDADFFFQQDLSPLCTAKSTQTWFYDHFITVLNCPKNSPNQNTMEKLWSERK